MDIRPSAMRDPISMRVSAPVSEEEVCTCTPLILTADMTASSFQEDPVAEPSETARSTSPADALMSAEMSESANSPPMEPVSAVRSDFTEADGRSMFRARSAAV